MIDKCFEEIEKANLHLGGDVYISDLLRIDLNFPIRQELLQLYLK